MQAPEQGHGNVRVTIDESGQDQLAFGIDRLRNGVPGFHFAARADGDDGVTFYREGTIVDDVAGAVHGNHGAAGDEQVSLFFVCLRGEDRGKEKLECENENDRAANDHL